MDLSQYAELFLAESREHLSACNQLLLEWERQPAGLRVAGGKEGTAGRPSGAGGLAPPAAAPPPELEAAATGRLVQVTLRPEAPLKGGRALLVLKRALGLGAVHAVTPPQTAFEAEEFEGRFSFRLDSPAAADQIEAALRVAGDVAHLTVGGEELRGSARAGA